MDAPDTFTPVQLRTFELLKRPDEPVVIDPAFIDQLVHSVRSALADLSRRAGGEELFVAKSFLQRVHGCEVMHLHEFRQSSFSYSPATAAGFVAHKAIELAMNWRGEPQPGHVVDEAIALLADATGDKGRFIAGLSDTQFAELRSKAVDRTTKFMHDFPPLPASAQPVLESGMKFAPPGTITLSGKADLMLGKPYGTESRRVIIDFKTGWRSHHHRADLRFYALVHTLKDGVPPRRLVTYYLDESIGDFEDVNEGLLESATALSLIHI